MEHTELAHSVARIESAADFAALLAEIERSPGVEPELAAAALRVVRNGVITGEGPTTAGRVHFSRSIDEADTALVNRILVAGGAHAVTRAEADALFDIHEAAFERADGGAFDALLAKAIAHHVLAASGRPVPDRTTALAAPAAPADWACDRSIDPEVAAWLNARMRRGRHQAALATLAIWLGIAASWPVSTMALDLAA